MCICLADWWAVCHLLLTPLSSELGGSLFLWKVGLLLVILVAMVFVWRPFCRALPAGCFFGLCNRLSFYQLQINPDNCSSCGSMRPGLLRLDCRSRNPGSECIRCLQCIDTCHRRAISWGPVSVKTGGIFPGERPGFKKEEILFIKQEVARLV